MSQPPRLSILDQSIIRKGSTAKDAINETIETARMAERLGFHRFWVSEHHNSPMIAGSAPEVLMVKLADETEQLRIGSGGIMLPNHSAYKVAENFRLLETMFPGRIDLGIGRAPGGDRISAAMLNPSNTFSEDSYLRQLQHLQAFFHDEAASSHGPLIAAPQIPTVPQQWILCSSGGSAAIAAKNGLGLVIARFINGKADPEIVESYRSQFKPSDSLQAPVAMLAITVLCADTEEKAAEMRKLSDYTLLQFERGNFSELANYEDIRDYAFSAAELQRIEFNSGRIISGTPSQVKQQLEALAAAFQVEEIICSCMTSEKADRLRSFELLAELFDL
ncbi:MAG: MsnO8 family LLM class oxidoreductase [Bacteroidetes bacterium]|nr:MsnO8 family LLM class oxidoreductase [Bacteroidota bacterium]